MSDRGVQYSRNVQDIKKIPIMLEKSQKNVKADNREFSSAVHFTDNNTEATTDNEAKSERPKRVKKMPKSFNDMVIFCVFD
jgi:hypothetical protein